MYRNHKNYNFVAKFTLFFPIALLETAGSFLISFEARQELVMAIFSWKIDNTMCHTMFIRCGKSKCTNMEYTFRIQHKLIKRSSQVSCFVEETKEPLPLWPSIFLRFQVILIMFLCQRAYKDPGIWVLAIKQQLSWQSTKDGSYFMSSD